MAACCAMALAAPVLAQDKLEEINVTGRRLPSSASDSAYAIQSITAEQLEAAPEFRIDEILRRIAGMTLFRRASSLTAHPTTQGVTLRSLGPNGAGRTLVLLDGVPLNDPFGGWVYWSALDLGNLQSIDIVNGAGAGRWGSGALAGTISLNSRLPVQSGARGQLRYGRFNSFEARAGIDIASDRQALSLSAGYFDSDGYKIIAPGQRGVADIAAASDNFSVGARYSAALGENTRLTISGRYFEEDRVNGLELSTNRTEALDISAQLVHDGGASGLSAALTVYYRDRDFANSFASVDDARITTRMVLDQFDVPGDAIGALAYLRWPLGSASEVEWGADLRAMDGATNERFRNLGDGFTRLRRAGGEELILGTYLEATTAHGELTLTGGIRLDYWETTNGERFESNISDGSIVRQDVIEDQNDVVANGRLGLQYQISPNWSLRAAAYTGFRLPTINEFFRPFRVGNDITEANPELGPERIYGIDIGFDGVLENGAGTLSFGYFRNWLKDAVGNVTIGFGPGFFPLGGFVPAGGVLRQRQNMDRVTADGLEFNGELAVADDISLDFLYRYTNTKVRKFDAAPELVGQRLAQSPRHRGGAGLRWQTPVQGVSVGATLTYSSAQFEDDLNSRRLDGYLSAGLTIAYALSPSLRLSFAAENLFDTEIEAGLRGNGLLSLGQPRLWWLGISGNF